VVGPCELTPEYKQQVNSSCCGLPSSTHLIRHRIQEPGGTLPQTQKTYFSSKVKGEWGNEQNIKTNKNIF
jgi:hypothetical protein